MSNRRQVMELFERRFAHEPQHAVVSVLGSDLQAAADVISYQFLGVLRCDSVACAIARFMKQHIISHSAAYEALLYLWHGIDLPVQLKQCRVVNIEVRTDFWLYT